jgi:hypothetical protein
MRLRSYTPPEAEHALLRNRIVTHDSYTANLKVRRAGVSAGAAYLAPRSALRSDPALPRGLRKSLCPRTRELVTYEATYTRERERTTGW